MQKNPESRSGLGIGNPDSGLGSEKSQDSRSRTTLLLTNNEQSFCRKRISGSRFSRIKLGAILSEQPNTWKFEFLDTSFRRIENFLFNYYTGY